MDKNLFGVIYYTGCEARPPVDQQVASRTIYDGSF